MTTAHTEKLRHRVAGVFLFAVDGDLYLQTGNKYGCLDISVGGHVRRGESYDKAAKREMLEEINLEVDIKHTATFLPENAKLNHFWAIYTAVAPAGWKFTETEEVKSMEKMSPRKIFDLMASNPDLFTHGFHNAIKNLRPDIKV